MADVSSAARLWSEAAGLVQAGTPAALATVAKQRGSLPMAGDAKMLVTADGRRAGTIGGGCVEADVVRQALATLDDGTPSFVKHTLNADLAGDIGLSCGGTVDLFLEPLFPSDELARLCDAVANGIEARAAITILTGLEWNGRPEKAALVDDQCVSVGQSAAVDPAAFPERKPGQVLIDEERSLFVEWIPRTPRVIIFGAGHVGAAIASVAAIAGFHVVVIDDRDEFANKERVPRAHEIIVSDFGEVLDRLVLDEDDYVLAATRGHGFDATIVQCTAASRARYVGMLGSRRKQAVVKKALATAGVPAEALERVKTPIGLEIGADTPAEIAVSVVAELIRTRRLTELSE